MLTHRLQMFARAILLLLALLTGLALANAQPFPVANCCQQALTWKASYERTLTVLDSTRAVSARIIRASDERSVATMSRANAALDSASREITYLNTRNQQLLREQEGLHATIDETTSRLTTTEGELHRWKPRTKAGVFLRRVRNGLAIVGGGVIATAVLRLIVL